LRHAVWKVTPLEGSETPKEERLSMSSNALLEDLSGEPAQFGLFNDVHCLRHGQTKLILEGFKYDPQRKLPLYLFDLQASDGSYVGQYHFAPGPSELVGDIGNAGGHVDPPYRNRGHSKNAIKALSALARRHGMDNFIISCGIENGAARRVLSQVGRELAMPHATLHFFEIPAQ
jgi:RimJ/RimL family protein N-acetyltransferase